MTERIELPIGSGRVVIGPPAGVPIAGSGVFHVLAAIRMVFARPDAVARLRAFWSRLGLGGNAGQMADIDLRRAIERAVEARRLAAMYLPAIDDVRLDIGWYEARDKNGGPTDPKPAGDNVGVWTAREKIQEALRLTVPKLRSRGERALVDALEALVSRESVAVTIGLFAALAAAHAYGVGEIADLALVTLAYLTAGAAGVKAIVDLAQATADVTKARNRIDLDRVASRYAAALIVLGEAFLTALLTRILSRRAGGRQAAPQSSSVEYEPVVAVPPATMPRAAPARYGSLTGIPTKILPQEDLATRMALEAENESARILADAGFNVEQNPVVAGLKNPDYLIDGKIYDNIAPSTARALNILDRARQKVESGQADNLIINLKNSAVELADLRRTFQENPIEGLNDVKLILKNGSVIGL